MDPVAAPRRFTLPRGTETILIVEDEYTVRALARRIWNARLHGAGCRDRRPGLRGDEHLCSSVDLLLTDIIMPGANGRDLAQLVTTSNPTVKVLYMSGYDDGELAARLQGLGGALPPGIALLEKPFTPEGLRAASARCSTAANRASVANHIVANRVVAKPARHRPHGARDLTRAAITPARSRVQCPPPYHSDTSGHSAGTFDILSFNFPHSS